jgi:hypothetical protein
VHVVRDPDQEGTVQTVEKLVQRIGRWRLTLPSILFLEVVKPFSFIASQGLLLCQPLLGFLEIAQVGETAELLAERSNIEHLIARLEQERATQEGNGKEED